MKTANTTSLILNEYVKATRLLSMHDKGYYLVEDSLDSKTLNDLSSIKSLVETSLMLLSSEEKEFLNREFLDGSCKTWWINVYSRSSYYRLRERICSKFLNNLKINRDLILSIK